MNTNWNMNHFRVDPEEVKRLTQNNQKIPLKLDADEVVEGQEVLINFECLICRSIPIKPI